MSNPITETEALSRAVKLAGGQTALAAKLTEQLQLPANKAIRQTHVWNWLNREKRSPPNRVIAIEIVVGGQVTRNELRADLYPLEAA